MSFRKYRPDAAVRKKPANRVRVRRSYYTFSKYYPAGDTNRVYRKSISRARKEKKLNIALCIASAVAVIGIILLIILL